LRANSKLKWRPEPKDGRHKAHAPAPAPEAPGCLLERPNPSEPRGYATFPNVYSCPRYAAADVQARAAESTRTAGGVLTQAVAHVCANGYAPRGEIAWRSERLISGHARTDRAATRSGLADIHSVLSANLSIHRPKTALVKRRPLTGLDRDVVMVALKYCANRGVLASDAVNSPPPCRGDVRC
jgi:hypothetical protein